MIKQCIFIKKAIIIFHVVGSTWSFQDFLWIQHSLISFVLRLLFCSPSTFCMTCNHWCWWWPLPRLKDQDKLQRKFRWCLLEWSWLEWICNPHDIAIFHLLFRYVSQHRWTFYLPIWYMKQSNDTAFKVQWHETVPLINLGKQFAY